MTKALLLREINVFDIFNIVNCFQIIVISRNTVKPETTYTTACYIPLQRVIRLVELQGWNYQ